MILGTTDFTQMLAFQEAVNFSYQQVFEALRDIAADARQEVRAAQHGELSLDVVLSYGGVDVAVEVDGPSHFVGRSRRPTGATQLKRRLLKHSGCRLLSVPYWDWDALRVEGDPEGERCVQREYLEARLEELLRCSAAEASKN